MKKLQILLLFFIGAVTSYAQTGDIIVPTGNALLIENIIKDKQGKYLYTTENTKIVMWDVKNRDQLYTFQLGANQIGGVDVSHDGKMIAIANDGVLQCFSTVTGKQLFSLKKFNYRAGIRFSVDDTKIYGLDDGIFVINIETRSESRFIDNKFDNFHSSLDFIDANHVVIRNNIGWQIWNLNSKTQDFEYKFTTQTFKSFYLPLIQCIASRSYNSNLEFRNLNTGKLIKSIPVSNNDYMIIPSEDSKEFLLNTGSTSDSYTLYDGLKFFPIRNIKTNYSDRTVTKGYFSGKNAQIYFVAYQDVFIINTKTNKKTGQLKRQVANLGMNIFSTLEYNKQDGIVNFMVDDSVFKSVNLLKLFPFRHQPLPINSDMITFSATGDTIAVFDGKKGYIKNIKTGKFLQPAIKLVDDASSNERVNFFFSKNGDYVYYTTFSIPNQINTLNRISVKSGLSEKMFTFRGSSSVSIHPDKDLLTFIEKGYRFTQAKVWNIVTNKLLFEKSLPYTEGCDLISLSADKKNVLMVRNNQTEIYDLTSGNLLSKSNGPPTLAEFSAYYSTSDLSMIFRGSYGGQLTAYNKQGAVIYSITAHSSSIRNVLISPNDEILYTVSTDQSIKVWQTKTGKLYGTLYLFNDGNDYVFIDPFGRFDGTEGGIKRMYYFRNRIKISLDVVYEKFYTPNLYQRLINGEKFEPINIIINPPPLVKISYAQISRNLEVDDDKTAVYKNTSGVAEITVHATAENDKIDEIRLFHNGKIVNLATRGLFVTDNTSGTDTKKYTVNLLPGINKIRAVALNSQRTESKPDEIEVSYSAGVSVNQKLAAPVSTGIVASVDRNATLHLIVVGINKYQNEKMSLNYALADATAFKNETELGAKTMISNVKTYFVADEKANKNGIVQAFNDVQKVAKPQDVFVFYYAGHGVISQKNKEFYLVPTDVTDLHNADEALAQKGIPSKLLQQYAIDISAQKQVFILDACQSAGAFETMLASDGNQQKSLAVVARSTGTHWIAASGSQQFANEFSSLGHGVFTYVLLKALKGEAANNKMITVNGLKNFLQQGVPALMKKYNGAAQYPASYGLGSDFPIEIIK